MPGKVNPTQCGSADHGGRAGRQSNDTAISVAASQEQFRGERIPAGVTAYNFLLSCNLLADAMDSFRVHCVDGITQRAADGGKPEQFADAGHLPYPEIGYRGRRLPKGIAGGAYPQEAVLARESVGGEVYDRIVQPEKMVTPTKWANAAKPCAP